MPTDDTPATGPEATSVTEDNDTTQSAEFAGYDEEDAENTPAKAESKEDEGTQDDSESDESEPAGDESGEEEEKTFAQLVEAALENPDADESEYPDEVLEHVRVLRENADLGKKATNSAKQIKALQEVVRKSAYHLLSDEQRAELEELAENDKEAWYAKRAEYENAVIEKYNVKEEKMSPLDLALTQHNSRNPKLPITEKVIADEVPPRLVRELKAKLEADEITASAYVKEIAKYLGAPKTVSKGATPAKTTKLGKASGAGKPSNTGGRAGNSSDYDQFFA